MFIRFSKCEHMENLESIGPTSHTYVKANDQEKVLPDKVLQQTYTRDETGIWLLYSSIELVLLHRTIPRCAYIYYWFPPTSRHCCLNTKVF